MRDFDDNKFPLGYLITFRCYGTWLHGDDRGAYRRSSSVMSGVVRVPPRPGLRQAETEQLIHSPVQLNTRQRKLIDDAIREVCFHRNWVLRAINPRTNHVHAVVSASSAPEPILATFKSYSTRALRRDGLEVSIKPWSRHGSTIYLWKEEDVARAVAYVALGQDHPFSIY